MHSPVAWYDSVAVVVGEGAGWSGFDATLARVIAYGSLEPGTGAEAVVDLRNGAFGYDENSLSIAKSDSSRWFRAEAMAGTRGRIQSLDLLGRHVWGAAAGFVRGRHRVDGAYSQRATGLLLLDAIEDATEGESGFAHYRYRGDSFLGSLLLERGRDEHRSLGILLPSIRLGQEVRVTAELEGGSRFGDWGLRAAFLQAQVERANPDDPEESGAFDRKARSGWAAARLDRSLGAGRLRIETGAGHHGAVAGTQIAPSIAYHTHTGVFETRIGVERLLQPVWSDLATDVDPFLQRTWAGVIEAGFHQGRTRGRATFLFGRTHDRALVRRHPSEEVWLRLGTTRELVPQDFGVIQGEVKWEGSRFSTGGEGYFLARDYGGVQADVDPAHSFRLWGAGSADLFGGDLGLWLRLEFEGVGSRVSQGVFPELCGVEPTLPLSVLPSYLTSGATAAARISGTLITLRVRNLENRARPEPWADCETLSEALGPGREWRLALTFKLAN